MPATSAFTEPTKAAKDARADHLDRLIHSRFPYSGRAPVVLRASRRGRVRAARV